MIAAKPLSTKADVTGEQLKTHTTKAKASYRTRPRSIRGINALLPPTTTNTPDTHFSRIFKDIFSFILTIHESNPRINLPASSLSSINSTSLLITTKALPAVMLLVLVIYKLGCRPLISLLGVPIFS